VKRIFLVAGDCAAFLVNGVANWLTTYTGADKYGIAYIESAELSKVACCCSPSEASSE